MLVGQHVLHRLLRHQKAAERADRDRVGDVGRHKVCKGAARPSAGVIDDDIRHCDLALDLTEQPFHFVGIGGIAGESAGAGLGAERAKFFDLAVAV